MAPRPATRHSCLPIVPVRLAGARAIVFGLLALAMAPAISAQPGADATQPAGDWAACTALADNAARLACFDRWAAEHRAATARTQQSAAAALPAAPALGPAPADSTSRAAHASANLAMPVPTEGSTASDPGLRPCSDPQTSPLSRFWELEPASDCGTFGIRVYRPLSLSWIGSDSVNTAPSTPSPGHTATRPVAYSTSETRVQLSVRSKIARGLLTTGDAPLRDSLWIGYTQQSYWQLFNGDISRPFRSTDHEPELIYIFPLDEPLEAGWRVRYAGLSLNHQSNGQSLPLSRSWNRIILMAGMEQDTRFALRARLWARVPEKSGQDDNPDISDMVGRAELAASWNIDNNHTLGLTLRHSLRSAARGSVRLEWMQALGPARANGEPSGLRWHVQLFSGYGDSLLDYNRRRTVLSLGLSLVDF